MAINARYDFKQRQYYHCTSTIVIVNELGIKKEF